MTDLLTPTQVLRSVASKKPDYAKVSGSELIISWDGEAHVELAAELLDLNQDDKVYSSYEISAIYIDGEEIELDCETEQLAYDLAWDWCLIDSDYLTEEAYREAQDQDEHEAFYMNWERI